MTRTVVTEYGTPIEVGTKADDGRLGPDSIFVKACEDRGEIRTLTQRQALQLASALIDTVQGLMEAESSEN